MNILTIAIPLALALACVAIGAFAWIGKTGKHAQSKSQQSIAKDGPNVRASGPYDPQHRSRLASTHAETPHARLRASLADIEEPKNRRMN
jgi:cbb3-type cytochrome oxidase maturation protein